MLVFSSSLDWPIHEMLLIAAVDEDEIESESDL
jgi:hypothetical protein